VLLPCNLVKAVFTDREAGTSICQQCHDRESRATGSAQGGVLVPEHLYCFPQDRTPDRKTPEKGNSEVEKVAFAEPGKG
jgi:hypothetical protein